MTKPKFFSKFSFARRSKPETLPAVVEPVPEAVSIDPEPTAAEKAEADFGLTEVQGVGFLEDFKVYSKIPAERWANAESGFRTGGRMTTIQQTNLAYSLTGIGTLVSGTTGIYASGSIIGTGSGSALTLPTISIQDYATNQPVLDADVELPVMEEAVEAAVVPEGSVLTPVQVVHELRHVPNSFSQMDIEKKLVLYKSIVECVRSDAGGGIRNTLSDVRNRIQARVKYRDVKAIRQFFDQFQCTDDAAIADLLEKYTHLSIGPADDFIPEMPDDALEIMVLYTKRCVQASGKKPLFFLIAETKDFKKKKEARQRRDPILLVQAPFGFYWQILGAYGPEMRMLEEL